MNKSFFTGNVASDPELKANHVLTFRIAVDRTTRNAKTGEYESTPEFFPFAVFGNRADALAKFLAKGMPVTIEAHARQNTWETDTGDRRSTIEFIVDDIQVGRNANAA